MSIKNKGFTIIELMIAVAIIGILAAIAVPAYSNYTVRAKAAEAMTFADSAKTAVSEYYQTQGSFPTDNATAGLPSSITGTNVASVTVTNGVIAVVTSISGITNFTITYAPTSSSSGLNWTCSTDSGSSQYVPSTCR